MIVLRFKSKWDSISDSQFVSFSLIFRIAQGFGLRAKVYGKRTTRRIVVPAQLTPKILRQKLIEGDPVHLEKFEIIEPAVKKIKKGDKVDSCS